MRISMDGRGRFLDNIFIERLWRGREARQGIDEWMNFSARGPVRVYREGLPASGPGLRPDLHPGVRPRLS